MTVLTCKVPRLSKFTARALPLKIRVNLRNILDFESFFIPFLEEWQYPDKEASAPKPDLSFIGTAIVVGVQNINFWNGLKGYNRHRQKEAG
ncbi:uncharacterized protein N7487_003055 [Penicillium crustosum]|uniref:uncharacterized protein n=1 Tax=Penicillium crustosum TaxID=36656 RepID=UPI00239D9982|nr:uncharacterized protein N7487_003055 [Penicillium crustosum]KAJ5419505.1 hypothetical protein N7487_003055 [Penicillium crustosum]